MRLVLDEHLPRAVAEGLRDRGHGVVTARELWSGDDRSDAELLRRATADRRTVVTSDLGDFVALHHAATVRGAGHGGIVLLSSRRFPPTARATGRLVAALDAWLRAHPADDAGVDAVHWLGSG